MEKQSVREKIYKLKSKKATERDECKFNLVLRLFHFVAFCMQTSPLNE